MTVLSPPHGLVWGARTAPWFVALGVCACLVCWVGLFPGRKSSPIRIRREGGTRWARAHQVTLPVSVASLRICAGRGGQVTLSPSGWREAGEGHREAPSRGRLRRGAGRGLGQGPSRLLLHSLPSSAVPRWRGRQGHSRESPGSWVPAAGAHGAQGVHPPSTGWIGKVTSVGCGSSRPRFLMHLHQGWG